MQGAVRFAARGGNLTVSWNGGENDLKHAVWLTGPAVSVFDGEIEIDER
jgi:diaminopimelate epimerase